VTPRHSISKSSIKARRSSKRLIKSNGPKVSQQPFQSSIEPGLYIIASPIGNLGDITLRAIETLKSSSLIACEDTRITRRLLSHYNINIPTTAYHEHNANIALPRLIKRLKKNEIVSLISDAGTPLISDPGYRLVQAAIAEDIPITTTPGPVAAIAALTLSGLPTDSFFFAGFLPPKQTAKKNRICQLTTIPATLIFYESPRRLSQTLKEMANIYGNRPAAVVREISKKFEEVRRGTIETLLNELNTVGQLKGEIVLIIGPPAPEKIIDNATIDSELIKALSEMSLRDSVEKIALSYGRPKREVYKRALAITSLDSSQR
jgi:16S rRNA (cytidine1402-2'-O)-methyltransferase